MRNGNRVERCSRRLSFAELLSPAEKLTRVYSGFAGHLGCDCARLQRRSNDPLLLRPRPAPAPLHRRNHLNLRVRHSASPRISPRTCHEHSIAQGGLHRARTAIRPLFAQDFITRLGGLFRGTIRKGPVADATDPWGLASNAVHKHRWLHYPRRAQVTPTESIKPIPAASLKKLSFRTLPRPVVPQDAFPFRFDRASVGKLDARRPHASNAWRYLPTTNACPDVTHVRDGRWLCESEKPRLRFAAAPGCVFQVVLKCGRIMVMATAPKAQAKKWEEPYLVSDGHQNIGWLYCTLLSVDAVDLNVHVGSFDRCASAVIALETSFVIAFFVRILSQ